MSHSAVNAMRALRARMQIVFQDPYGSLSPRMTVGDIVAEGLGVHEPGLKRPERDRRVMEALVAVETVLLVLLVVLVAGLLRSHAEILRRLGPAGSPDGGNHRRPMTAA